MPNREYVKFLNARRETCCTPFVVSPPENKTITLDSGRKFTSVSGQIWEFYAEIKSVQNGKIITKKIPIVIIDSSLGKELLLGRFISGKNANDLYSFHSYVLAQLIRRNKFNLFKDIFAKIMENPEYIIDHEILRSGHYIRLSKYFPGLISQGDDIKRQPVIDQETMYQARATQEITFSDYPIDIVSEICAATGSSLEEFNRQYVENKKNGKYIIYNINFISIEAIKRSLIPLLELDITPIFICDEGIFNIYKKDLILPNGELIKAGTLIGIYDDKENITIMPEETFNFINKVFPVSVMPDICGEVGEKNQENKERDVITYDTNEFYELGIPMNYLPWSKIISKAYEENPDAAVILQSQTPEIYDYLTKNQIIIPKKTIFTPQKKKIIEIM